MRDPGVFASKEALLKAASQSRIKKDRGPIRNQVRYSALIFTYSWDRSVVQIVSLH